MTAPVLQFPAEVLLRAQDVRVAFFDIDGVMTDGGLFCAADGEVFKRFASLDGYGLKLLRRAGIEPAVVTGRDSAALRNRLQALGVRYAHCGVEDKRPAAQAILDALGVDWAQAAAIGDDWPDLPLLRRCAFAAAPPSAHAEVLARVHHVTRAAAGYGAAREFCDVLLVASGRYADLLAEAAA